MSYSRKLNEKHLKRALPVKLDVYVDTCIATYTGTHEDYNDDRANGQKMTNRRTHNLKTKQDSDFKLSVLIDKNICRS